MKNNRWEVRKIPQKDLEEIADFIGYLKMKRENQMLTEMTKVSESSLDFWDNEIDDEVWNDA